MGNQVAADEAGTIDPDAGANLTSLNRFSTRLRPSLPTAISSR